MIDILKMCTEFKANSPYKDVPLSEAKILQTIQNVKDSPDAVIITSVQDGKLLGMLAGIVTQFPFSEEPVASELMWWVDKDHRNTGIGLWLHTEFEAWAKSKDIKYVSMVLLEDENKEFIDKMFTQLGYKPTERTYFKELV